MLVQVGSIHNLPAVTPMGTRAPKLELPLRGTDCQLRQVSIHGLSRRLKEGEELAWGGELGAAGVKVWGFSPRGSALGPWEGKQSPQLQGSARQLGSLACAVVSPAMVLFTWFLSACGKLAQRWVNSIPVCTDKAPLCIHL